MGVGEMSGVVVGVGDAVVCVAALPDIQLALYAKREISLDELHCFFEGDFRGGSQYEMDVVGHDYEGVELQAAFGTLLLKDFHEEGGVSFDLEESAAGGCDEVGSDVLWGWWHG
jgi:hypothetical protein